LGDNGRSRGDRRGKVISYKKVWGEKRGTPGKKSAGRALSREYERLPSLGGTARNKRGETNLQEGIHPLPPKGDRRGGKFKVLTTHRRAI